MKPLLKCPYPVDCWGREMRITLSILIAERINQLRKSRKLSVNKLATMSVVCPIRPLTAFYAANQNLPLWEP